MNTNSPGGLMALPKSPCLISTPQSDLFPVLMGLPALAHVGTREAPLSVWRIPVFHGQTLVPAPKHTFHLV